VIVEPPGEAEGLEAGIRIERDPAKLVVLHPLRDRPVARVHDEPRRAQVVGEEVISQVMS
jgi:hypothetical protein